MWQGQLWDFPSSGLLKRAMTCCLKELKNEEYVKNNRVSFRACAGHLGDNASVRPVAGTNTFTRHGLSGRPQSGVLKYAHVTETWGLRPYATNSQTLSQPLH